ncbi:Alpha/Beta hydrolase protein [Aspergillus desertorum]
MINYITGRVSLIHALPIAGTIRITLAHHEGLRFYLNLYLVQAHARLVRLLHTSPCPRPALRQNQTEYGPVRGFKYFNESTLEANWGTPSSGSNVAAFLSIPFAADTGEDCLTVNIWTGANSSSDKLPVMIYNQGSDEPSNSAVYYGGGVGRKGVVAVTFNRRDDVFGYLAHPELNAESEEENGHSSSDNYGILDFLELLKWVQRNIENFGGDPDRVTIVGQSFGSAQVYHAVNGGLFKDSYVTMPKALQNGLNYTASHNATSISDLRKLSTEEILVGSGDRVTDADIWWVNALSCMYPLKFKPVLDGYVLPEKYIDSLRKGPPTTSLSSRATTRMKVGLRRRQTTGLRSITSKSFWNAAARHTSLVSSWLFAKDWAKSASSPFYMVRTTSPKSFYTMDTLYANADGHDWTWYDYHVAEIMSSYWVNFVKTGDPNLGGTYLWNNLTYWAPVGDGKTETVFHVGEGFGEVPLAKHAQVELITEYFSRQVPY